MDKTLLMLKVRLAGKKLVRAMHVLEAFVSCRDEELINVAKDYVYEAKHLIEEIAKE